MAACGFIRGSIIPAGGAGPFAVVAEKEDPQNQEENGFVIRADYKNKIAYRILDSLANLMVRLQFE